MNASARFTTAVRMQSGSLGSAGSPLHAPSRVVGVPSRQIQLDARVRSCSPDIRPRQGIVVLGGGTPITSNASDRMRGVAVRSSAPVWQEDTSRDVYEPYTENCAVPSQPPVDSDPLQLEAGVELSLGDHQLRCLNVLGSGSYSIVWRAEVLRVAGDAKENTQSDCRGQGSRMLLEKEVALKDVLCRSNAVLRQSLFEVQLLLALERRVLLDIGPQPAYPLRLPRCFAYKVDSREEGWRVRTAMTRLPGEQLDDWLRRAAISATTDPEVTWTSQLQRGCVMAEALVRQIGPTLQRLAPLAWHRDVNSHNVLVSEGGSGKLLCATPEDTGTAAEFWLIDLGLAVDSRSWVSTDNSQSGTWRVTDIGGDCRYWPASSWMVHLYGADYLAEREDFCRQYQCRLDSFGLGITAVELMCSTALAAQLSGASPVECTTVSEVCWARLLDAWQRYYDKAGNWWAEIYKVFSSGGDFRPVHSWLVEEQVADQVVALMEDLREGLRACMDCATDESSARILSIVAELIDEASDYELVQLCAMFPPEENGVDVRAVEEVAVRVNAPSTAPAPTAVVVRQETPRGPATPLEASAPTAARCACGNPLALESTFCRHCGARRFEALEDPPATAAPDPAAIAEALAAAAQITPIAAPPRVALAMQEVVMAGMNGEVNQSPEMLMQEAVSLASAAAAEGRQALASLPPIPPIAAVERTQQQRQEQNPRRPRQAELVELVEAQAQLRHDLERLQQAKMRLQQARRVHEEKKQTAQSNAAMQAVCVGSQ